MIAIVDYGMGNLRSVFNAFTHVGAESRIMDQASDILSADKVLLPGVGSFRYAMDNIRAKKLDGALRQSHERGIPILGICLGMQLLVEWGIEDGRTEGLGLIPGHVERLPKVTDYKIPHIGFNSAVFAAGAGRPRIFEGLHNKASFYFVHSYRVCCDNRRYVAAETHYGETFVSALAHDNVYGVQFHPEKSREHGLRILKNFASL